MAFAIPIHTNRKDPICGICFEDFSQNTQQWNHLGGGGHDPFHRECLETWVQESPTCPIDRNPINPASFAPIPELLCKLAKRVFTDPRFMKFSGVLVAEMGIGIKFGTAAGAMGVATGVGAIVTGVLVAKAVITTGARRFGAGEEIEKISALILGVMPLGGITIGVASETGVSAAASVLAGAVAAAAVGTVVFLKLGLERMLRI